jgi:ubiquitin-like protein Pup
MAERKTKEKQTTKREVEETQQHEAGESLIDGEEIDDLLEDIDSVLEENAEEFVKGYVQKGGQ